MKAIQTVIASIFASLCFLPAYAGTITTYTTAHAYAAATTGNSTLAFDEPLEYWGGVAKGASYTQSGVSFSESAGRLYILKAGFYNDLVGGSYLNNNGGSNTVTIDFAAPISAFAMHFGTMHNWGHAPLLTETFSFAGSEMTVVLPGQLFNHGAAISFIGYSSDTPFSSIRISDPTRGLAILDMMYTAFPVDGEIGVEIAEPVSLGLLAIGLFGMGAVRRARRPAQR